MICPYGPYLVYVKKHSVRLHDVITDSLSCLFRAPEVRFAGGLQL